MHSVQNGILLDSTAHVYFDKYLLAINPDVCITRIFLHLVLLTINLIQND